MQNPVPTMPRRSVRFSRRTKIYLVASLYDMSDEEIASTWTTEDDQKRIEADLLKNVKAMRGKPSSGTSEHLCRRGLEHMQSPQHLERRKIEKERVIDAVLDEQDRQDETGSYDESKIAHACSLNSKNSRDNAQSLAQADAAYVRRYSACSSSPPPSNSNRKVRATSTGGEDRCYSSTRQSTHGRALDLSDAHFKSEAKGRLSAM